jgi:hypothetical protein
MKKKIHLGVFVAALVFSLSIRASESWTNWNWASLGLAMPQTNVFVGGKIPASITVSNVTDEPHSIHLTTGDRCSCGFYFFSIIELSTGRSIECKIPREERTIGGSFSPGVASHKSMSFDFDIADGYTMTNAGFYNVQAIGWFRTSEPPTNRQHATVTTPPILIKLLPKPETNAPPQSNQGR